LFDYRRNGDILEKDLKVQPVADKLAQYDKKLLNYVSRMEDIRYPAQLPHYRPIRRRPGRPLKRLLDGYNRVRPKQVIC